MNDITSSLKIYSKNFWDSNEYEIYKHYILSSNDNIKWNIQAKNFKNWPGTVGQVNHIMSAHASLPRSIHKQYARVIGDKMPSKTPYQNWLSLELRSILWLLHIFLSTKYRYIFHLKYPKSCYPVFDIQEPNRI